MRPVRTVTSSALRSIPAWPPASAVSSIAFRCSPWPKRACSRLAPNAGRVASTHNFLPPLARKGRVGASSQSGRRPIAVAARRSEHSKRMKVLISGGSGLIGGHLVKSLTKDGHEAVVLSRRLGTKDPPKGVRFVTWDARSPDGDWVREVAGAQGVVNLAGASVGSWPWTRQRMAELLSSRLSATTALVQALERTPADRRPPVLVSASGIDYYGDRGDEAITEGSDSGDSFLARLSQQWEAEAQKAEPLGIRVALIRTAMVFGREALRSE